MDVIHTSFNYIPVSTMTTQYLVMHAISGVTSFKIKNWVTEFQFDYDFAPHLPEP